MASKGNGTAATMPGIPADAKRGKRGRPADVAGDDGRYVWVRGWHDNLPGLTEWLLLDTAADLSDGNYAHGIVDMVCLPD